MLYRQARAAAPRQFDVLHLSGLVAYQQGRVADAVELLARAHKADPKHAVCEMRYGVALIAAQRPADAEKHLRHAVATKPDFHEGWDNLAYCLKTLNRLAEAIACHEKAVGLKPDYAVGWYNFGLTLSLSGRSFEALACHDRALAADPNYAVARFGRAQALQQTHRIPEAIEEYGRFIALQPAHPEARSYRLFALHYLDNVSREQLLAEHVAYGRVVGQPKVFEFPNRRDAERKLRVAILSPDLRTHSCAFFLEPLLQHLDRERFELYLYHDHIREDAVSRRLRAKASVWRNFASQLPASVEKAIREDAPDILIDLAGHTGMTSRLPLLARRLAPVQILYLGYPDTSGVPAMDYRFTDALADPEGADAFATEKLVRFAPTAWTYAPPADAPEVGAPPCLARGHVTFGCFNNLAKVNDRVLGLWGRVLQAIPTGRLHLKGRGFSDAAVRARYHERFARTGVPVDRVDLVERTAEIADHLGVYRDVDIALDTFPYHGTTTTCEALWMGRPVVTLAGDCHMARVGVSLLTAVQHPEWIARDEADYVRIAAELAANPARIAADSAALRGAVRASPLFDHAGQSARFGEALRNCWREWCAGATRSGIAA